MMTLIVLLAAVVLVVAAGEAVRSQCRRMLDRPVRLAQPMASAASVSAVPVRPVEAESTPAAAAA